MKRRRTAFATPFVVTAACGSSPPPPREEPVTYTPAENLVPVEPTLRPTPTPPAEPPYEPPVADAGSLIVQPREGGSCYLVYERTLRGRSSRYVFDEGEVPCPPGGPNVKLPEPTIVTIGRERYRLDEESLHCYQEILGNPPGWQKSECPPQLVPEVVGVVPDANCVYRGVKVRTADCQPTVVSVTAPVVKARIIGVAVVSDGTEVVIGAGTDQGVGRGMTVRIRGLRTPAAKITSCSPRTCRATFTATPDQIKASELSVTIESR